jgi:hypothetical protein
VEPLLEPQQQLQVAELQLPPRSLPSIQTTGLRPTFNGSSSRSTPGLPGLPIKEDFS